MDQAYQEEQERVSERHRQEDPYADRGPILWAPHPPGESRRFMRDRAHGGDFDPPRNALPSDPIVYHGGGLWSEPIVAPKPVDPPKPRWVGGLLSGTEYDRLQPVTSGSGGCITYAPSKPREPSWVERQAVRFWGWLQRLDLGLRIGRHSRALAHIERLERELGIGGNDVLSEVRG